METMTVMFDEVKLQKINLSKGDILSVKLISDDFDELTMQSLKEHLESVFPNNKIMIFTMPSGSDIVFEAVTQKPVSYCDDCSCGKKEQAEK